MTRLLVRILLFHAAVEANLHHLQQRTTLIVFESHAVKSRLYRIFLFLLLSTAYKVIIFLVAPLRMDYQ